MVPKMSDGDSSGGLMGKMLIIAVAIVLATSLVMYGGLFGGEDDYEPEDIIMEIQEIDREDAEEDDDYEKIQLRVEMTNEMDENISIQETWFVLVTDEGLEIGEATASRTLSTLEGGDTKEFTLEFEDGTKPNLIELHFQPTDPEIPHSWVEI